jgi:hypothetical protein
VAAKGIPAEEARASILDTLRAVMSVLFTWIFSSVERTSTSRGNSPSLSLVAEVPNLDNTFAGHKWPFHLHRTYSAASIVTGLVWQEVIKRA